MDGWQLCSIEEFCLRVTSGGTPSRRNPAFYQNGTIDWIKTGELKDWFVDEVSERITEEAISNSSAKIFPKNTVLIAMYGDGRTIGSLGILRHPAATNQACCAMIVNEEKCLPKFLLYSLIYHRRSLISLALGGAQRNLNGKTIRTFKINIPPLDSQRKIAALLSAYDHLIENNKRRIQILEEISSRIYEEWFVRFRFPGHENIRMVESKIGFIPDGWNTATLKDTCSLISRGISPKYNDVSEQFVINQKCIRHERLNLGLVRRHSSNVPSDKEVQFGDVLINSTGVGTLGRVAQVYTDVRNYTVDTHVTIVRPKSEIDKDYFGLSLLKLQTHFERLGFGATGQTELSRTSVANTEILLPLRNVQVSFSKTVSPMRKNAILLTQKNENLRSTRDWLLPKLISGQIDVSNFPEPE